MHGSALFLATAILAPIAASAGPSSARAEENRLPLAKCSDMVGTFLTKNYDKSASKDAFISRSQFSFTDCGHAYFTDSRQDGRSGFAPFSGGRGAWRCVSEENGATKIVATILDFKFATAKHPEEKIARIDLEIEPNPATHSMRGDWTLYFVPLEADPLQQSELKGGLSFTFTGQRVDAALAGVASQ